MLCIACVGLRGFEEINEAINIGIQQVWGGERPFGFLREDRRRHMMMIGKTGSGKSSLMKHLIIQDIAAGNSVAVLDPHGDLSEELLHFIPRSRTKHLVYFNPTETAFPIGMNLLSGAKPETRPLVASSIVSCFKHIWGDSWGPRLEYLLYASVLSLLSAPGTTLLGIPRLFTDSGYRRSILHLVTDPVVLAFWREFEGYDPRFRNEIVAPVQNKVGAILMAPALRNIVGQVKSTISIPFVMDNERIFIANLSKGKLGEDKASLLGALLVTQFQISAMRRADIPESERKDCFLYVDEFQTVATDAFCSILSEARKYRLCLTLGNQFTAQLRPAVRDSVFGNVGSIIAFRTGSDDAQILAREFGDSYRPEAFSDLSNFEILVKTLRQGESLKPFHARLFPPLRCSDPGRVESLARVSNERFGNPRNSVEEKIGRWFRVNNVRTDGMKQTKRSQVGTLSRSGPPPERRVTTSFMA